MKPETSTPEINSEQAPTRHEKGVEVKLELENAEAGVETGAEAYEKTSDLNAIRADVGLSTVLPTPIATLPTDPDDVSISSNPPVASDDDLIEKEWVDKAKKIVAETKDDPYKRDKEVNKLQVDYLKKRFGREIGITE